MTDMLKKIEAEVRICGQRMLDAHCCEEDIGIKGKADFVTKYDKLNQEHLAKTLPPIIPGSVFVGEEEDIHASIEKGFAFIVDPIDGTTNFIRDYHNSAVSVGITKDGEPFAGVIYNPYLDEMFTAQRGVGTFLNGKPIHVSDRKLENGIVIFGTTLYEREKKEETFRMAYEYFNKSLDVRRSGSAALDLCSIACGRCELFFESRLSPWDYAAGIVIVEEAGGQVLNFEKKLPSLEKRDSIIAASREILAGIEDPRHP